VKGDEKLNNIKLLKCISCKRSLTSEKHIYETNTMLNSYYICQYCYSKLMEKKDGLTFNKKRS